MGRLWATHPTHALRPPALGTACKQRSTRAHRPHRKEIYLLAPEWLPSGGGSAELSRVEGHSVPFGPPLLDPGALAAGQGCPPVHPRPSAVLLLVPSDLLQLASSSLQFQPACLGSLVLLASGTLLSFTPALATASAQVWFVPWACCRPCPLQLQPLRQLTRTSAPGPGSAYPRGLTKA